MVNWSTFQSPIVSQWNDVQTIGITMSLVTFIFFQPHEKHRISRFPALAWVPPHSYHGLYIINGSYIMGQDLGWLKFVRRFLERLAGVRRGRGMMIDVSSDRKMGVALYRWLVYVRENPISGKLHISWEDLQKSHVRWPKYPSENPSKTNRKVPTRFQVTCSTHLNTTTMTKAGAPNVCKHIPHWCHPGVPERTFPMVGSQEVPYRLRGIHIQKK